MFEWIDPIVESTGRFVPGVMRRPAGAALRRWIRPSRQGEAARWLLRRVPCRVMSGPFAGSRMVKAADNSGLAPRLLGTYEQELHGWVESVIASKPSLIVNVGAADGYYTIGLLRRLPEARSIAFEMLDKSRRHLTKSARINGVADRLDIRGACDAQALQDAIAGHDGAVIIVDIEGAELDVLDPTVVPDLGRCELMIETHDGFRDGVTDAMVERLYRTHELSFVDELPRRREDVPADPPSLRDRWQDLTAEHRVIPQQWIVATRRAASQAQPSVTHRLAA
ncbi:MAG: hypothetical protein AAF842_11950 [Planctomycetota bacterium]